jgi:hypothetical protein
LGWDFLPCREGFLGGGNGCIDVLGPCEVDIVCYQRAIFRVEEF